MCEVNHLGICATVRNLCKDRGLDPDVIIHNAGDRRYAEFMEELPANLVENLREGGARVDEYSRHKHGCGIVYSTLVSIPLQGGGKMTRKDYRLIALAISDCRELTIKQKAIVAESLAYYLGRNNDRFNEDRFITACKVED